MTAGDALQLTEKYFAYAKSQTEVEYYNAVRSALKHIAKDERVSLVAGANEDGILTIYTVPMGQEDTWYGKILHTVSDVFRGRGLVYADRVSQYFYGKEPRHCKSCYHRAEYIVHGWLCGLALFAMGLVVFELLVKYA